MPITQVNITVENWEDLEPNKLLEAFPLMNPSEYQQLSRDIEIAGLQQPITIYENTIIDGRCRYNVCRSIGKTPVFQLFEGTEDEAFQFVLSANLHRRQLTPSQRAVVAVNFLPKITEEKQQERIVKMREEVKTPKEEALWEKPTESVPEEDKEERQVKLAADILTVRDRYIDRALDLRDRAPEVVEEVFSGAVSIPQAFKQLEPEEEDGSFDFKPVKRALKSLLKKAAEIPPVISLVEAALKEVERLEKSGEPVLPQMEQVVEQVIETDTAAPVEDESF